MDAHLDLAGLVELRDYIADKLKVPFLFENREVTLLVEAARLPEVLQELRDNPRCQFTQLMDICGVDYLGFQPAQPKRFAVVYHLLSLTHNQRIRVKVYLKDGETIPSCVPLFVGAGWYERETYDMYGIVFDGNPDLRRILTDYDFVGFPLRKDFPLEGHVEVYYDAQQKRVAYKPVDLPQEFRHFDRVSEWQGMTGNVQLADEDNEFRKEEFK
jgi:NADH-quinone oxidoreductase subunit C